MAVHNSLKLWTFLLSFSQCFSNNIGFSIKLSLFFASDFTLSLLIRIVEVDNDKFELKTAK